MTRSSGPVKMLEVSEGHSLPDIHIFHDPDHVVEFLMEKYVDKMMFEERLTWRELYDILFEHEDTWNAPDDSVWRWMPLYRLPETDHR